MTEPLQASAIDLVVAPTVRDLADGFKVRRALPSGVRRMVGPFILLDHMGPALFAAGRGLDLEPHPHIGLETLTYLIDGEISQRDHLGAARSIRPGDVNLVTAGQGIVHSERTPAAMRTASNSLFGFQAWIALPSRHEEIAARVAHHAAPDIPRTCARGVEFNLIAGTSDGLTSPVETFCDMMCAEIVLTSGARYQVRPGHHERALYVMAGEVEIVGQSGSFGEAELVVLKPGAEVILRAPAFHAARIFLIGGEPLPEPRHIYWNFVSSSSERIEQAKRDWRERRFPTVPGEDGRMPLPEETGAVVS